MDGRDGQVGCFHFPHLHGIEPHVRLMLDVVAVVRLGLGDHMLTQEARVLVQVAVRETSPDLPHTDHPLVPQYQSRSTTHRPPTSTPVPVPIHHPQTTH